MMIRKTQGIVLRQQKFSDTKRIVNIFTRDAGKKSFVLYNSSKKNNKINFFQPLFVLNLEFLEKQNSKLLNIKDVSIFKPYKSIPFVPEKTSIVFFIAEVLNKVIQEHFVEQHFFDFIVNALYVLDNHNKPANFHLSFLSAMSIYLGIMPEFNYSSENKYFDLKEGQFSKYYSKNYSMDEISSLKFNEILSLGIENFDAVKLNQQERKILLGKIIDFYSLHFSINNLKSIEVLTEIFS
ncbi:MAG: DNA repair protein RecO [Bacteroidales bacterium]|nr:DNA repair protein RecO [Bacteroidales bacterium]